MRSSFIKQLERDEKLFKNSYYKDLTTNFKKVDVNVLLNKVKINKSVEKKRNIIFIASIFLGLNLTAYIIFS
tara:strand:- start:153 stop:368 length:216 start_codon:yes stop_codon:yes gene_type:complete